MPLGVPSIPAFGGGGGGSRSGGGGRSGSGIQPIHQGIGTLNGSGKFTPTSMPPQQPPTTPARGPVMGPPDNQGITRDVGHRERIGRDFINQKVQERGGTNYDGTYFTSQDGTHVPYTPQAFQQHTAMSDWLQAQGQQIQSQMARDMLNQYNQYAYEQQHSNVRRGFIDDTYQNDLGMLAQDRYRQVDLAREGLGIDRGRIDNDKTHINNVWDILQRDIGNRRGTTDRTLAIQQWLNDQGIRHNNQQRSLTGDELSFSRDKTSRNQLSDATARGAYSSRGHRMDQLETLRQYNLGIRGADLTHDRTRVGLQGTRDMDQVNYDAAINALNNQFAVGQEDWRHGLSQNDLNALANALEGRGLDSLGRTFDLRQQQLGTDYGRAKHENSYNAFNTGSNIFNSNPMMGALAQLLGYQQSAMGVGGGAVPTGAARGAGAGNTSGFMANARKLFGG